MKRLSGILAALVVLAGCSTADQPIGEQHPVARQLSWFAYLDGADIRRACGPDSADVTRLVFNNVWPRQARVYQLTARADGGATLNIHVQGPTNLFEVIPFLEQKWAWHGKQATVVLTAEQHARVVDALKASDAFGPPPVGTWLDSDASYWVMTACRDGKVDFNAWAYPSERWKAMTFDEVLFGMDVTEVPVRPLVAHDPNLADGPSTNVERYRTRYRHRVGETELDGVGPTFAAPPLF